MITERNGRSDENQPLTAKTMNEKAQTNAQPLGK